MKFIHHLPLAKKIRALTMLATSVALVLAGIPLLGFESYSFYHTRVDTLKAVAGIIGSNSSAAIIFHDSESGKEILGSLSAKASIIGASLYAGDGTVIAIYDRVDKEQFHAPAAAAEGYGYSGGRIRMFHSIRYNGETIGTLPIWSPTLPNSTTASSSTAPCSARFSSRHFSPLRSFPRGCRMR